MTIQSILKAIERYFPVMLVFFSNLYFVKQTLIGIFFYLGTLESTRGKIKLSFVQDVEKAALRL